MAVWGQSATSLKILVLFPILSMSLNCTGLASHEEDVEHMLGSVSDYEQGEVLVFQPVVRPLADDASAVRSDDASMPQDIVGGVLASVAHLCSDGRPVWMRSANDVPTLIAMPSQENFVSSAPEGSTAEKDMSVALCVKRRYGGAFRVGLASDGTYPWRSTSFAVFDPPVGRTDTPF